MVLKIQYFVLLIKGKDVQSEDPGPADFERAIVKSGKHARFVNCSNKIRLCNHTV